MKHYKLFILLALVDRGMYPSVSAENTPTSQLGTIGKSGFMFGSLYVVYKLITPRTMKKVELENNINKNEENMINLQTKMKDSSLEIKKLEEGFRLLRFYIKNCFILNTLKLDKNWSIENNNKLRIKIDNSVSSDTIKNIFLKANKDYMKIFFEILLEEPHKFKKSNTIKENIHQMFEKKEDCIFSIDSMKFMDTDFNENDLKDIKAKIQEVQETFEIN